MFGKIFRRGLILYLCAFCLVANARAQEDVIPPAKRALIQELLTITNSQINYDAMLDGMMRQAEDEIPKRVEQQLTELEDLSPADREEMRKKLIENSMRFSKRFRELLPQKIILKQEVEAITFPLYHKYFTEQEIRDIISFYKSPVGRKTVEILPQLMIDTMKKLEEIITPKVQRLVKEIIDEQEQSEKKESTEPAPAPG